MASDVIHRLLAGEPFLSALRLSVRAGVFKIDDRDLEVIRSAMTGDG